MKIITDSAYAIGRAHNVCQDYALSDALHTKKGAYHYVIVTDGCSSSPDTDFGARLVAAAMRQAIEKLCHKNNGSLPTYGDLAIQTIATAMALAELTELKNDSIDATAMLAIATDKEITVYAYGDGNIIHRDAKTGKPDLLQISYENNMPFYLTYWLDGARRARYTAAQPDNGHGCRKVTNTSPYACTVRQQHYLDDCIHTYAMDETLSLTIATDGLQSMSQHEADAYEKATDLTDYKVPNGAFLQRRLRRFLSTASKKGAPNDDDIAAAALVVLQQQAEEENDEHPA